MKKMNALAIFTFGLAVVASAKPYLEDDNKLQSSLRDILRSLNEKSESRPKLRYNLPDGDDKYDLRKLLLNAIQRRGNDSRAEGDTQESEMRCDEEKGLTVPCMDIVPDEEFFECALNKAREAEGTFNRLFKENNDEGKDLFHDEEMKIVYDIRTSDLVSMKVKEYTEMMVEEIGYLRFTSGADTENMSEDDMKELMDTHCIYSIIKDESYKRLKKPKE